MIIQSKENNLIKYAKKLTDKKFAVKENKTIIESPKIIIELLEEKFNIDTILVCNDFSDFEVFQNCKAKVQLISASVAKYLSQTETTTGVFAIIDIPKSTDLISDKVLVLDHLQDPTNYGAIIRSAVAFGFNTIIDINCVFPYSSKVTRSSMGHNFRVNIIKSNYESLEEIKTGKNFKLICCDMNGNDLKNTRPDAHKFAIIIGNEGNGVSDKLKNLADMTISIPMDSRVESLNASVSAGIIMYTLTNY